MKKIIVLWGVLLGAGCNEVLGLDADFSVAGQQGGEAQGGSPSSGGSGAGGSATHGGSSAEGGGGGAVAVEATCEEYCQVVEASCANDSEEYMESVCPVMCGYLSKGHVGDTSGDTVGCRMTQAELAQDDPAAHCQAAGPLGAGPCADRCESFCQLVFATCGPHEVVPYANLDDCKTKCASYPYLTIEEGGSDINNVSGDTLNCRLYHLQVAANPDIPNAFNHCGHVGAVGPCNPP